MMTSFYNLLKYAQTGIASPDMSYYDKLRASTLIGGVVQTLTGQPPLSFPSDGSPIISLSMKGNGQQTGTPTHDNPILPEFVGVRTAQLFDKDDQGCYFANTSLGQGSQWKVIGSGVVLRIPCTPSTAYTISLRGEYTQNVWNVELTSYDDIPTAGSPVSTNVITSTKPSSLTTSFTTLSTTKYILLQLSAAYINSGGNANIMLNTGSTALPYELYGSKIPITCDDQTVPVYLGQVPTVRKIGKLVFDGTEDWKFSTYPYIGDNFVTYGENYLRQKINICVCTHLQTSANVQSGDPVTPDTCCFNIDSIGGTFYYKDTSVSSLSSFKSWLQQQYAAGTPVTLWYVLAEPTTGIVNEPLCKIGDYADELHSTDAGVSIPTVKGQNVLTVETDLQPSEVSITYRG